MTGPGFKKKSKFFFHEVRDHKVRKVIDPAFWKKTQIDLEGSKGPKNRPKLRFLAFQQKSYPCRYYFLLQWESANGSFHVKWTKFQKSSHLTFIDFAEILSSQCTHQDMKVLNILLSSRESLPSHSHLNYQPYSLDIESLQFMAFWNSFYQPVLIVNFWNFD